MSNTRLIFVNNPDSNYDAEMEMFATLKDTIFISITSNSTPEFIALDLETAIRFSKELRREIAKIKERGSNNG